MQLQCLNSKRDNVSFDNKLRVTTYQVVITFQVCTPCFVTTYQGYRLLYPMIPIGMQSVVHS